MASRDYPYPQPVRLAFFDDDCNPYQAGLIFAHEPA